MKATQPEIERFLALLDETPKRLASLTDGLAPSILHRQTGGEWSANDVLAHLRSCADVWGASIESMLAEEMPTLPYIHPHEWLKQTNYTKQDFHKSLREFTRQRGKLLKILMKLSLEDWSQGAMIGGRVHTVFTQARRIAKHETEHCHQIEDLLK
jgi:hypothetical protein